MKNYYNLLITTLSSLPRSIRWTLILGSQIPLLLMTVYVWVLATHAAHTTGAVMLLKNLREAGTLSQGALEATALAFAPSASGLTMLILLLVGSALGAIFLFVALVAARKATPCQFANQ